MLAILIIYLVGDYRWVILAAAAMAFAGLIIFSMLNKDDTVKIINDKTITNHK
jgi:hypothetical protein